MTLTKTKQNTKILPIELIFEISKSINGYTNLVINKKLTNTAKQPKCFVWKIECIENVLVSSKIIYARCGEALKKIMSKKIMEESDFKKYSEEIDKLKEERRGLVELMNQMNQQLSKLDQKICDLEKKMEAEMKEKHGESSGGGKRKCEDTSTEAEERSVKKIRLDVDKESVNVKEEVEDQGLIEKKAKATEMLMDIGILLGGIDESHVNIHIIVNSNSKLEGIFAQFGGFADVLPTHAETINNKIASYRWPDRAREEDASDELISWNAWEKQVNEYFNDGQGIILDFFKFLVEEIIPNFNLEEVSDIIVALKMLAKSVYKIAECYYNEYVYEDAGDDVGGYLE